MGAARRLAAMECIPAWPPYMLRTSPCRAVCWPIDADRAYRRASAAGQADVLADVLDRRGQGHVITRPMAGTALRMLPRKTDSFSHTTLIPPHAWSATGSLRRARLVHAGRMANSERCHVEAAWHGMACRKFATTKQAEMIDINFKQLTRIYPVGTATQSPPQSRWRGLLRPQVTGLEATVASCHFTACACSQRTRARPRARAVATQAGLRTDSSNYDPVPGWIAGAPRRTRWRSARFLASSLRALSGASRLVAARTSVACGGLPHQEAKSSH
jgi:hypothetical protein